MSSVLWAFLVGFQIVVFFYFLVFNGYYLSMCFTAYLRLRKYMQRLESIDVDDLIASAGAPPVTVIVPVYNEADSCVEATRSFLALRYPDHEVLLVNDGSTDATLEVLKETFDLVPAPRFPTAEIETAEVRGVYHSRTHPNLWVIDKENGQRADAINAGINFCRTPFFCAVDADGLLERDALIRVVRPFLEDDRTVASGGSIRILNGCLVDSSVVQKPRLPKSFVAQFQALEYIRSFLAGRVGWDELRIMFLISGAFGLWKRSMVVDLGGLATNSVGEDLELTVRIHRHCREEKIPYRVSFVPDPVAWTEVPERLHVLGRQRNRWRRGLIDAMVRHRKMLFNPDYGRIGMVAYPYFFFLEMMGPVVEFIGYFVFAAVIILGVASVPFAIAFLLVAAFLGMILTVVSVVLEELTFQRYESFGDLARLFGLALLENIGFRQILTYYRFKGTLSYFFGSEEWGRMERKGINTEDS
jgi:cellulose synthase/poly-beta-1,6-N-acetylglucosamine synthase-like glycosyltransferase